MVQTQLTGKVVLVTGANHGIGAATARAFAAEGAKVLLNYLILPPLSDGSSDQSADENIPSRSVALMMAEFVRRRVAQGRHGGRIINLSTDGAPGFAGEVSYGASKAALESYSRAAAKEFGRYGITVNIVSPGSVQTGWIAPELEKHLAAQIPLGRVGQPAELPRSVLAGL